MTSAFSVTELQRMRRLLNDLVGPQGERGAKGDPGVKGDTGEIGATGDTIVSTSTQYAFQATSNYVGDEGLNPSEQMISLGVKPKFNDVEFCVPNMEAYDPEDYKYTCPVAGIYKFGFKIFIIDFCSNCISFCNCTICFI